MKKTLFFTMVLMFTFSANSLFAVNSNNSAAEKATIPVENRLSAEEISQMTKRVEEIRDMDKSDMNAADRKELRKELKEIKKDIKKAGGTVYISGGALILIIILLIILL